MGGGWGFYTTERISTRPLYSKRPDFHPGRLVHGPVHRQRRLNSNVCTISFSKLATSKPPPPLIHQVPYIGGGC